MRIDRDETSVAALPAWTVGADRSKRARAVLIGLLAVGLGVGLLPGPVQAHEDGAPGLGGAQIHLSSDGYEESWGLGMTSYPEITGKGFMPLAVAEIFRCVAGETDLRGQCERNGAAPTDQMGRFGPTPLPQAAGQVMHPDGRITTCKKTFNAKQCSVVAATFDPMTDKPTHMAEHYICLHGGPCEPKPTGSWSTTSTTTTTVPPRSAQLAMGEDGYPPGERLTGTGQAHMSYTSPINVSGRGFVPLDVVEIFECLAGEKRDLRAFCQLLAVASTSGPSGTNPGGEFSATVSLMSYWYKGPVSAVCRGIGASQCSVIAATFDHTDPGFGWLVDVGNTQPTSMAENYICFAGPQQCADKPGGPTTTTTSTTTTIVPPPITHHVADFDGNGSTDVSVFRPSEGMWYVKDGAWTQWGQNSDVPVPADYDGDGATDVAIFRPDTGLWAIRHSGGRPDLFVTYGIATDVPVPADYDGDGKADIAIFRPEYGLWWVHQSSTDNDVATTFGIATDIPVPGDYDGDDSADLAVFRDGTWYVAPSTGGPYISAHWGNPGDIPVPADYDADSEETTDFAVFRPSAGTWYVDGQGPLAHGASGDVPVAGHYDADPFVDVGVFRPSTGEWLIADQPTVSWGGAGDMAVALPYAIYHRFF